MKIMKIDLNLSILMSSIIKAKLIAIIFKNLYFKNHKPLRRIWMINLKKSWQNISPKKMMLKKFPRRNQIILDPQNKCNFKISKKILKVKGNSLQLYK